MPNASLDAEVAFRLANGGRQVTLAAFDDELRALGYRLDRSVDCPQLGRYLTGPRAGASYPSVVMGVVQVSDGTSFANVHSRRDANFDRLQNIRFEQELFAVHNGRLYDI